jgi:hypothetical protein
MLYRFLRYLSFNTPTLNVGFYNLKITFQCICMFSVSETIRVAHISISFLLPPLKFGQAIEKISASEFSRCTSMYVSTLWSVAKSLNVYAVYKVHVISQNSRRKVSAEDERSNVLYCMPSTLQSAMMVTKYIRDVHNARNSSK